MESVDTESKQSYIGSFLQPPDNICSAFMDLRLKNGAIIPTDTPVPNNKALVAALEMLQEKIHRLELERSQAEDDFHSLSREAALYKRDLQHDSTKKDVTHQELMQQRKDVSLQLEAAQSRCSLLEKQLDYMRKMVVSAELEKKLVLEQQQVKVTVKMSDGHLTAMHSGPGILANLQTQLQKEKEQNHVELCLKLDKLEILEKECQRLINTQKSAEDKIKCLEQKLQEEQHQRKLIQDKASQLETGLEMNRILLSSFSPQKDTKKKSQKKKIGKKNSSSRQMNDSQLSLQTRKLPFVVGMSASSSHSVAANVQSVLHKMKYQGLGVTTRCPEDTGKKTSRRTAVCRPVSSSTSSSATENLSDLLLIMQDELGQMNLEHQELLKQIEETENQDIQEDLERELDCLVKQMEIKGEQISKLKKHREHVYKLKQKAQKLKRKVANTPSKSDESKGTKETAVISKGSAYSACSMNRSKNTLELLKSAQKLQSVLKKDDIVWES